MKKILLSLLLLAGSFSLLHAQDFIDQKKADVLKFWQKKVTTDKIKEGVRTDGLEYVAVNNSYYLFKDGKCVGNTTLFDKSVKATYEAKFKGDKKLHFDSKRNGWVAKRKKIIWTVRDADNNMVDVGWMKM